MTEQVMDINNFEQTSNFPPQPGEPTARDGYKWLPERNSWIVDLSQSQTKRFKIMLAQNPDTPGIRSALLKERQLDGYVQRLKESKAKEDTVK